jgi:hypothetical protein
VVLPGETGQATVVPQSDVGTAAYEAARNLLIVRNGNFHRRPLLALLLLAPLVTGCSGGSMSDMFSSDLMSRDADWFKRTGRLTIENIQAPPLTPDKPITAEDLVSPEGMCPGMAPPPGPTEANASAAGAAALTPQPVTGTVALGHTECDVVRGIGVPSSVNISRNERGDRLAVVTYSQGPRPGIYTFNAGRLSSIEGVDAPPPAPKPKAARSRAKVKKKPAQAPS